MERLTIAVEDMACGGCEDTVERALQALNEVNRADADQAADQVTVVAEETVSEADLTTAIRDAGYDVPT